MSPRSSVGRMRENHMLNELEGSSSRARSTTLDHTSWAVASNAATDILIPQNLSTCVESPWGRQELHREPVWGEAGRSIARALCGAGAPEGHLTLFLRSGDARPVVGGPLWAPLYCRVPPTAFAGDA